MTREEWLNAFTDEVRGMYADLGCPIPAVRLTCGWPLSGGRPGAKSQTIGQCFAPSVSSDGHCEIFISPVLDDTVKVAEVTLHELAHAAVGVHHGHRKPFVRVIRALHLGGPATATHPTPEMEAMIAPVLAKLGPYPHAAMRVNRVKKQSTRMLKAWCPDCEMDGAPYIVRMSASTMQIGLPICPIHGEPLIH